MELAFGAERKKDAKRGWKPTNSAGSTEALGRPFGGASASSLGQHLAAKVGGGVLNLRAQGPVIGRDEPCRET